MILKSVGAILIVVACGSAGWSVAGAYRAEANCLMRTMQALESMRCELEYRVVPLPVLCKIVSEGRTGPVGQLFSKLGAALEAKHSPDATDCMAQVLAATPGLPPRTKGVMEQLGRSLGRFDLSGQLRGIDAAISRCETELDQIRTDMDRRLRSYRTLGLCAGSAVAILLL